MPTNEIIGAVIDANYVTSDRNRIDAALMCQRCVEFVSRGHARSMARWTNHPQWVALAAAPALWVIVDGVRYRQHRGNSPISFPMSAPSAATLPATS